MIARLFRSGVCMLLVSAINTVARVEVATVIDEEGSSSYDQSLFHHVNSIEVLGPSSFPRPTEIAKTDAHDVVEPYLKPVIGKHRPDQDAVFAYAAEYPLENYMAFIASLRETGFKGDIVLGVSSLDLKKDEIRRYLSTPNIIVYKADVICRNLEGDTVDSAKGGSRGCQFNDVYARQRKGATGENEDLLTGIPDPRPSRTLQIMRYEIYWIMAQNYNPDAWIFLVDARDTVFQSDPFADVPRKTDPSLKSGLLYFFGESTEATRLGRSKFNRKWLTNAYGGVVATALAEKPTICSGTTMGEQVRNNQTNNNRRTQFLQLRSTCGCAVKNAHTAENLTKQHVRVHCFLLFVNKYLHKYG